MVTLSVAPRSANASVEAFSMAILMVCALLTSTARRTIRLRAAPVS